MDEASRMKGMDHPNRDRETRVLHSQLLQWSSDSALLGYADANAVSLVDLERGGTATTIRQAGVAAIALFCDQVWTLDEKRTYLRRFHVDGSELGERRHLAIAPCTRWIVPMTGVPAVLMEGTRRQLLFAEADKLIENENRIPAAGLAFPLHGRAHVFCSVDRRVLWGGRSFPLAAGITVLGGAAVGEGRSLLLIVADPRGGSGALVVDADMARVQQSFALQPTEMSEMRVAAQRGFLLIRTSDRRLAIVDAARGSVKDFVEAPVDIDDFAVDPAAKRIAIRSGSAVFVYSLAHLTPSARPELALDAQRSPVEHVSSTPPSPSAPPAAVLRISLTPMPPEPAPEPQMERLPIAVGAQAADGFVVTTGVSPHPNLRDISTPGGALQPFSARDAGAAPRASTSSDPPLPPIDLGTPMAPGITRPGVTSEVTPRRSIDARPARSAGRDSRTEDAAMDARIVDMYPIRAFGTPPKRFDVTRHDAARMLEGELQLNKLRALAAIARSWDTGRIAYANNSHHPSELEVGAILHGAAAGGRARDQVEEAEARLGEHERALAQDPSRRTDATLLGALAAELELSPTAIDILIAIAAPALDDDAVRLYSVLANDPTRPLVDERLVAQILAGTTTARRDIAFELGPNGALRLYGLVEIGGGRPSPHAPLTVDPVVLARLCAEPVNFGPGAATTIRAAERLLTDLLVPDDLVLEAIRYLSRKPSHDHQPRIALRGPTGSGRRTLLAALAHRVGRDVGLVDLGRLPRDRDGLASALRIELRRAWLRGLVPCVVGLDDIAANNEDPIRDLVRDVLRSHAGPAAVHLAPRSRVPLDPGHLLLELKPPTETQRLAVWREALAERGLTVDEPERLAARYRVGPGTIRSAVSAVANARAEQGRLARDLVGDIQARMRQACEVRLGENAKWIERVAKLSELVLPDETTASVCELIGRVRHQRTVFEEWGMGQVVSTARGLTALFEGPPGTGKTLAASVIAGELGVDLYRVDTSAVTSKWVGETEKNLGAMFDAAEDGNVILLFDEADSLLGKRTEVKNSTDRFGNAEVNYLLQRLDSFQGLAILTTNLGSSIDPAFKRRLSFQLAFTFPDPEMRVRLWRAHLPPDLPTAGHLDLHALARYQLSGGYIRNACVRAAFLAAQAGSPVTQEHLEKAVELVFADVGKLSTSGRME